MKYFKIIVFMLLSLSIVLFNTTSIKANNKNNEYIFKFSDKKVLTDNEIKNISPKLLPYARNEIFARHGYIFKNTEFKEYFNKKIWYKPNSKFKGNMNELNKVESKNVELIKKYEAIKITTSKKQTKFFYIKNSYIKNNKKYIVVDFIEWLTYNDWERIKKIENFNGTKEEVIENFLLDDYYIYNEKKEHIIYEVQNKAEILKLPPSGEPKTIKGVFGKFSVYHPHQIVIENGIVMKIQQYYVP